MFLRNLRQAILISVLASTLLSCRDESEITTPPLRERDAVVVVGHTGWTAATLPDALTFEDPPQMEIAREMPSSFGGFYFSREDPEQLVISLTNEEDRPLAEGLVRAQLTSHGRRSAVLPARGFSHRVVEYTFLELARYRTVLSQDIFEIPGVVALGVQESLNRVNVGIAEDSSEPVVRELLRNRGIPSEAVVFERLPYPQADSDSLTGPQPDTVIQGGWEVHMDDDACTLGFPAIRATDSTEVFVVNSHCTEDPHSYDGGWVKQPVYGNIIGYEIVDPETHRCGLIPDDCRYSDAALIQAEVDIDFERLARTRQSSGCEDCTMPITVDPTHPTFTIVDLYQHAIEGETLHKIGKVSGWTYGDVKATCDDYELTDGWVRQCSDRVNYSRRDGDSGAPVFKLLPSGNVELRGIHFGHFPSPWNDALMSDLHQIVKDLGELIILNVRAGITGPILVPSNTLCQWEADVVGGSRPYTYTWRKAFEVLGTNDVLFLNTGTEDFMLLLEVYDADGNGAFAWKQVVIDDDADPGIFCY